MTRKDLETKSIEKLNSMDVAIELINLLNYDYELSDIGEFFEKYGIEIY